MGRKRKRVKEKEKRALTEAAEGFGMMGHLTFWMQHKERLFHYFRQHIRGIDATERRIYIDRKSPILLVAHLDTVQTPCVTAVYDDKVEGAGFDDRLGCLAAYCLAEKFKLDLLLCDNEEMGRSTAQDHVCLRDYHWVAEFDRRGKDVVTYDKDSPEFLKALRGHFSQTGRGSSSDIRRLDTKACCVNIGIGYYNEHATHSFFRPSELKSQIECFEAFYDEYKNTPFKWVERWPAHQPCGFYGGGDVTPKQWGGECSICGGRWGAKHYDTRICRDCFRLAVGMLEHWRGAIADAYGEDLVDDVAEIEADRLETREKENLEFGGYE